MPRELFGNIGKDFGADELTKNENMPAEFSDDYLTKGEQIFALASVFQAFKEGTKIATASFTPVTGWEVDANSGRYSLEVGTGEITVRDSAEYQLSVWVQGDGGQLSIKAQRFDGSSWVDLRTAADTNDPSVKIDNYSFGLSAGEKIRIVVAGSSVNINEDQARITLNRKT